MYTVTTYQTAKVSIAFGQTTSYGLSTWTQTIPAGGGKVSILVAGMQGNTTYHMQAQVTFSNGKVATDSDHTFQTGAYPSTGLPTYTVTTSSGRPLSPESKS